MFTALSSWWKGEGSNRKLPRPSRPGRIFIFDSLFLKDCHAVLTQEKRDESLVYVTGILSKGVAIPQRLVPVKLAERSGVHAKADPWSSHQALLSLDRTNHCLLAVLHDHPWNGPDAVFASSTDLATQGAYESNGYPCISGVFSLDGYVRFFMHSVPAKVVVCGGGVENHGQGLYRIGR